MPLLWATGRSEATADAPSTDALGIRGCPGPGDGMSVDQMNRSALLEAAADQLLAEARRHKNPGILLAIHG